LLFVTVTMAEPTPLPIPVGISLEDVEVTATGRHLLSGNWLDTPLRAASAVHGVLGGADVTTLAPNLALVRHGSDTFAVFSRPAGHTRSVAVWALLSTVGADRSIDPRSIDPTQW
jgi:hypothetical protein